MDPIKPVLPTEANTVMVTSGGSNPVAAGSAAVAHFLVPSHAPEAALRIGSEPLVIGRSAESQLRLEDPAVSGRHCSVRMKFGLLWVEDLGSTNGTFVDGRRIAKSTTVPVGAAFQVGPVQVRHELRDEQAVAEAAEWSGELKSAARYITDLLPEPWSDRAVNVRWRLVPCGRLGGDSLGYAALDSERTALYVIDVCGHGLRAALHSVSILNALRQRSLAVDYSDPGAVLTQLNRAFSMEAHGGMFFTIWYGVLDRARRRLRFAAGGHPPALLRSAGAPATRRLGMKRPPIGTLDDIVYASDEVELPPDSLVYVYSDGVVEEAGRDGKGLGVAWLESVVLQPRGELAKEPERIEAALRAATSVTRFQDDFTLVVAELP